MARPRLHDAALRGRLLERAGRMVAESGVDALSLRTLAVAEATSTSAIYSLFGGKLELLGALFDMGNAGFGAAQRAVPVGDDAVADLMGLAQAYRDWALAQPHLFRVIFGGALAGFRLSPSQIAGSRSTIEPLYSAVHRAIAVGAVAGDVDTIALACWATVHGLVSLALACEVDISGVAGSASFDAIMLATLRGWVPTGGSLRSAACNPDRGR